MRKILYLDIHPFNYYSPWFHEISFILEVDDEIKAAYQYKLVPENFEINEGLLNSQGYSLDEIQRDNNLYSYEFHTQFLKFLDQYVDKFIKYDKLLVYCWTQETFEILKKFFRGCNDRYFYSYFIGIPVLVSSLVANKFAEKFPYYETLELRTLADDIMNIQIAKDTLSRVSAIYQFTKITNK